MFVHTLSDRSIATANSPAARQWLLCLSFDLYTNACRWQPRGLLLIWHLSFPCCPKTRCGLSWQIGIRTAWIITHRHVGVDVLLPDLFDFSLRHWSLPTVPDAGQTRSTGTTCQADEAQLRELALEFSNLVSRSLTNMACRSSSMFLDITKAGCDPVFCASLLFRQHFILGTTPAQKFSLLRYLRFCGRQ